MNNLDVFISHSHKDKKIADAICHSFEHEKIKCWMAPRDIKPGDNWATTIVNAIPECKVMLVVFSSHSNMSKQVLREVEIAVNSGLTILPVRIEDIMPTGGMKYYLSTVHWIDAVDADMEEKIATLLGIVQNMLDKQTKQGAFPLTGNLESLSVRKSTNNNIVLYVAIAGIVIISGILLLAFRDSIFKGKSEAVNNQPTEQVVITAEPIEATAEPIEQPTASADGDVPLDTVVDIPDANLRLAVLRTLDSMGKAVEGAITVHDMQSLTSLVIAEPEMLEQWEYIGGYYPVEMASVITSLEGLQYATRLRDLIIINQGLEDISPLSQINTLTNCVLDNNNITDISPLYSSVSMEMLNVNNNHIEDFSGLSVFYRLNYLGICGNPIADHAPLASLTTLGTFAMDNTGLNSLDFLNEFDNLAVLSMDQNGIRNLDALVHLENLQDIDCRMCELDDISAAASIKYLRYISLSGCYNLDNVDALLEAKYLESVELDYGQLTKFADVVSQLTAQGVEIRTER